MASLPSQNEVNINITKFNSRCHVGKKKKHIVYEDVSQSLKNQKQTNKNIKMIMICQGVSRLLSNFFLGYLCKQTCHNVFDVKTLNAACILHKNLGEKVITRKHWLQQDYMKNADSV
jgi:hypothetical protein